MKVLLVATFLIIFSVGSLLAYGDWSESMGDMGNDNSGSESLPSSGTGSGEPSPGDSSLPLAQNASPKPSGSHSSDLDLVNPPPAPAPKGSRSNLDDKFGNQEESQPKTRFAEPKLSQEKYGGSLPVEELPKKTRAEEPIMEHYGKMPQRRMEEHYGKTRVAMPMPSGYGGQDLVPKESIHTRIEDQEPVLPELNKYGRK